MMMKKKNSVFISLIFILFSTTTIYPKIEELNLTADHGFYKEIKNQKVFIAQGNAHILIDNNEIFCDEMEIYLTKDENVEKAIFKKNIRIFQEKEKIQIGGEYAEYLKEEKHFIIRENAFYIDVKEEVAVFGDSIHNYDIEKVALIQGNVRIIQKSIYSTGAFVKYTRRDKVMEISGFPSVENEGSQYHAKKIIVDVENNSFVLEGGIDAVILSESADTEKSTESKETSDYKKENPEDMKEDSSTKIEDDTKNNIEKDTK